MNSSLIGKIEKAKRYAEERTRIRIRNLEVEFHGENDIHHTGFAGSAWHCTCDFFAHWHTCSHTMALERVLDGMLPAEAISTFTASQP